MQVKVFEIVFQASFIYFVMFPFENTKTVHICFTSSILFDIIISIFVLENYYVFDDAGTF